MLCLKSAFLISHMEKSAQMLQEIVKSENFMLKQFFYGRYSIRKGGVHLSNQKVTLRIEEGQVDSYAIMGAGLPMVVTAAEMVLGSTVTVYGASNNMEALSNLCQAIEGDARST